MSSAEFEIDVGSGYAASPQDAAPGSTVTCRLIDPSGVLPGQIEWSVTGTSGDPAPGLTIGGTPSGETATFTMPASVVGSAVGITCRVNGGTETTGGAADTFKGAIYALDPSGRRPTFFGETSERDATHGVVPTFNELMRAVGPDGAYDYVRTGETTLAAAASGQQLDAYSHGLTNGLATVEVWAEAVDSGGESALYGLTQQWVVTAGSLSLARNVNPTEEESDSAWVFEIYDAGSGAIGIRAGADPSNATRFKWTWRISTMERPS